MEKARKFISFLSDYGFKVTFGDESQTLFLRKALEALIESDVPIKEVKFLRNEFIGMTKFSRGGLYDLLCEDENGNSFIVEMQLGHYKNFIQRSKFYAFHRFNTLVAKGNFNFGDIPKIYCIGFLASNLFPKSELYIHYSSLKNQIGENIDDQMMHIIVEISKFDKVEAEVKTNLDKLIFVMKNLEEILKNIDLPDFLAEDWIEQAVKKLDISKMTPEQRMFFEMTKAKQGSMRQMQEEENEMFREKGMKEGVKEGVKKTALKMKEEGVEFSFISKMTGLSIKEIENL